MTGEENDFSVGDDYDGEIFKDGVDGNGEVLEGPIATVGHCYEEQGDRQPCFCQGAVVWAGGEREKRTFLRFVVREGRNRGDDS
jgi:hypothetical protein